MKRFFALVLAVLLLVLCACSTADTPAGTGSSGSNSSQNSSQNNSQNSSNGETVMPTAPQIDFDAPALALTVKINPEFEITLNGMDTIVSVTPLNADAEALFAALDVVGQGYHDGMTAILAEAKTQGYLHDGAMVLITAEERQKGGWTVASQQLLELPIAAFKTDNNISVGCNITAAGAVMNPNSLRYGKTVEGEDPIGEYDCAFYYDAAGYNVMNILTYKDGTRREIYFPQAHINSPVTLERIVITHYPDGRYQHEHYQENQYSYYIQYPDGSRETYIGIGNWSRHESSDGVIWETIVDSNGTVIDEKVTYPEGYTATYQNEDGSTNVATLFESGATKTIKTSWPNGDYYYTIYREDGTMESYEHFVDGDYSLQSFWENGNLKHISQRGADGSTGESFYNENGEQTGYEMHWPNGNYDIQTFYSSYPTVKYKSTETMTDGYYSKNLYNESGAMVSSEGKDPDGNWYKCTYHSNGNMATYEAEGISQTFYENGQVKREVSGSLIRELNADGSYSYYNDGTMEAYFSGGKLTKITVNGTTYTDAENLSRYAAGFGITQ